MTGEFYSIPRLPGDKNAPMLVICFVFSIPLAGGRPNQIVKFNVMNLNKQAKLFSQGMHPVIKVGPGGRWERIKDKPSYSVSFFFGCKWFLDLASALAKGQLAEVID